MLVLQRNLTASLEGQKRAVLYGIASPSVRAWLDLQHKVLILSTLFKPCESMGNITIKQHLVCWNNIISTGTHLLESRDKGTIGLPSHQ